MEVGNAVPEPVFPALTHKWIGRETRVRGDGSDPRFTVNPFSAIALEIGCPG